LNPRASRRPDPTPAWRLDTQFAANEQPEEGEPLILDNIHAMPRVILDYLASVHPPSEKRTSNTAGTSYYMSVCGCGANFGDFYQFSEPILLHDSAGKPFLLQCSHQLLIIEVAGYLEGFGTPGRRMGFHPGNRRGRPAHRLDAIVATKVHAFNFQ
jgi:hypothetical protein